MRALPLRRCHRPGTPTLVSGTLQMPTMSKDKNSQADQTMPIDGPPYPLSPLH